MGDNEGKEREVETKKVVHTYPLVRTSDMPEEMKQETMELIVTACEKHAANNEVILSQINALSKVLCTAARMIKDQLDKKFGPPFHVVVGEGFGFEISYECRNLLYMFFGGTLAVCVWKC